jgi:hypothetical protein
LLADSTCERAFIGQTVRNMLGRMSQPTGSSPVDFQHYKQAHFCNFTLREITKIQLLITDLLLSTGEDPSPKKAIAHLQSGLHLSNLFSFPFILLFCSDNDIKLSHSTAPNPLQIKMQGT